MVLRNIEVTRLYGDVFDLIDDEAGHYFLDATYTIRHIDGTYLSQSIAIGGTIWATLASIARHTVALARASRPRLITDDCRWCHGYGCTDCTGVGWTTERAA